MLDYQLYGLKPGRHHLTNVLLHAAATILLFLVLLRMTRDIWPSAFVAALFAIHPLHVESVAWVSERKDVLSGLFFMLTLVAYVGYASRPFSLLRYLTVIVLFALGLMAKPMLVTLPFVLLLLDYWPLGRFTKPQLPAAASNLRFLVIEKIPLFLLAAASCVVTILSQGKAVQSIDHVPLSWRISNALVSYAAYLEQFFCPVKLAVLYPHPGDTLPAWKIAAALLVLTGISAGVFLYRRKCPYLLVGWLWYLGMLVPVIGLMQVGQQAMADRYAYLTQIGLYVAFAWGIAYVSRSWPHRRWACGIAAGIILAALIACAQQQTSYWRSSETLWERALACTARNHIAENNLGRALVDHGRADESVAHFQNALAIHPNYAEPYCNLGEYYLKKGRLEEAIAQFEKALQVRPDYTEALNILGNALSRQGRVDDAMAQFTNALEINPDYAEARNNLGNVLLQKGRVEDAIAQFNKAIEINPDYAMPYYNLGNTLANRGQVDEAIAHYEKALELDPNDERFYNNLGAILATRGESAKAAACFRKALQLKPTYAKAHGSLGNLLSAEGKLDEAIQHYVAALQSNPGDVPSRVQLAATLRRQGKLREAELHFREALRLDPSNAEARSGLASTLRQEGKAEDGETR